jgi:hypothetical protein
LYRRQEVKQSLLRQRENLDSVRERMEAELREDRQIQRMMVGGKIQKE